MTDLEECAICVHKYNKVRKPVACTSCDAVACTVCTKTFLLENTVQAKCMSCNAAWDMEYVRTTLSKSFLDGPYRQHQVATFLAEAETTLGDLQRLVPLKERMEEIEEEKVEMRREQALSKQEIQHLHQQRLELRELSTTTYPHLGKVAQAPLKRERKKTYKELAIRLRQKRLEHTGYFWRLHEYNREYYQLVRTWKNNGLDPLGGVPTVGNAQVPRNEFFMACPGQDCRGRLSTAYKCGLCHHFFCSQCHGDKGLERDGGGNHQCKQEDKDTVALLQQNTKPCPNCHEGIYKASGCDQMWCVRCHRCFSWNTGKLLNGTIHNPHYYEYQRQRNGGEAPRVAGDIPCGGLPDLFDVRTKYNTGSVSPNDRLLVTGLHRLVNHLVYVVLPALHEGIENDVVENHRQYGVEYLRGNLSRESWGQKLYLACRKRERKQRIHQILDMVTGATSDLFRNWIHGAVPFPEILQGMRTLIEYANEQILRQNKQYGTHTRLLDPLSDAYYHV